MNVSRQDIKYNFLKGIILRLDFQGVMPVELESVIVDAKPILKDKKFNKLNERIDNAVTLKQDLSFQTPPIQRVESIKVYSFVSEEKGYTLDLSTNFITLSINSTQYIPYEEYADIFITIERLYTDKVSFITAKRLGFRKINYCYLKDISRLNDYFVERYLNYYNATENVEPITGVHSETFQLGNGHKINLNCRIEKGTNPEGELYKVTIDSDDYLDNGETIMELLSDGAGLEGMNDTLFNLYIACLTGKMINALKGESNLPLELIEGIKPNV